MSQLLWISSYSEFNFCLLLLKNHWKKKKANPGYTWRETKEFINNGKIQMGMYFFFLCVVTRRRGATKMTIPTTTAAATTATPICTITTNLHQHPPASTMSTPNKRNAMMSITVWNLQQLNRKLLGRACLNNTVPCWVVNCCVWLMNDRLRKIGSSKSNINIFAHTNWIRYQVILCCRPIQPTAINNCVTVITTMKMCECTFVGLYS